MAGRKGPKATRDKKAQVLSLYRAALALGDVPNKSDIAARAGVDRTTVYRWLVGQEMNLPGHHDAPGDDPKPFASLPDVIKVHVEETPESFRRFFNRYSGLVLMDHSFAFVRASYHYAGDCGRCGEPAPYSRAGFLLCDLHAHVGFRLRRGVELVGYWKTGVIVNVPPNFAKSTVFSVWLVIFRLALLRRLRVIILSQTDPLALEFTGEIEKAFIDNEDLIRDFGRFKPRDPDARAWMPGKGMLRIEGSGLTRGHNVIAVGSGSGSIQGRRADIVIADDVVDPKRNVATVEVREALSDWYKGVIETRLDPGGLEFVVGTRWHPEDLYGELADMHEDDGTPVYEHINFPALSDPETGLPSLEPEAVSLWPHPANAGECLGSRCRQCRSREFLNRKIVRLGSIRFQMVYQQIPLPPGSGLIRAEWVEHCKDDRILGQAGLPREQSVRALLVDPSAGAYQGWIVADFAPGVKEYEPYVLDLGREKAGQKEFLDRIVWAHTEYGIDFLVWEGTAVFKEYGATPEFEVVTRGLGIRSIRHITGVNKSSQEVGVQTLAPDFEFARIHLPAGDMPARMATKMLADEAMQYVDARTHGRTTDLLMALWFGKYNLRSLTRRRAQQDGPVVNKWAKLSGTAGQSWKQPPIHRSAILRTSE